LIYWYANSEFSRPNIYIPGTEAAAATGAVVMMRCAVRTMSFNANHPFLFMIWDHRLQVPLFIGRFMEPASTSVGDQHIYEEL
jgi:serine protease inhibitor